MSYQQPPDMYQDNPSARSPGSQRHQQPLHRQPSRQFDAYGPMPVNLYEDPMARYDTSRLERLNPSLHNPSYAYDLGGSQTWNPNGFANPQAMAGIRSASTSLKTTGRGGRAGLPTVRLTHSIQTRTTRNVMEVLTCVVLLDLAGSATWHPQPLLQHWPQSAPEKRNASGSRLDLGYRR